MHIEILRSDTERNGEKESDEERESGSPFERLSGISSGVVSPKFHPFRSHTLRVLPDEFARMPSRRFSTPAAPRDREREREKARSKGASAPAAKTTRIVAGKFTMHVLQALVAHTHTYTYTWRDMRKDYNAGVEKWAAERDGGSVAVGAKTQPPTASRYCIIHPVRVDAQGTQRNIRWHGGRKREREKKRERKRKRKR